MTTPNPSGGFTGELALAYAPAAQGGCCGSAPSAATPAQTAAANPCCGTATEAAADNSCCGQQAKAEAVATGSGCCQ